MVHENLVQVHERIRKACENAGRSPDEVTLIAVGKTKPAELLMEAYDAGERAFGENKVQEILDKECRMPSDVRWHMIGHLQRNKVRQVIDKVELIHSVDSVRLSETIEAEAAKKDLMVPILIEVNIGGEESKYGVSPDEVLSMIREISKMPHIRIRGLMTIAPFTEVPEENRGLFSEMRKLRDRIRESGIPNVEMDILSMGMTNDYETAIEEGSTMVRIGTGIFGSREYAKSIEGGEKV